MHFNNFATTIVLALATSVAKGGVLAPAVAHAVPAIPAVHAVPAPIAYHHAIPYNVPPYSDRVDIHNKILSFAAIPSVHAVPAVPAFSALPHSVAHYAPGPVAGHIGAPILPQHAPFAYGHGGAFAAPVPAEFGTPYAHSLPAVGPAYAHGHPFVPAPAPALAAPFLRRR